MRELEVIIDGEKFTFEIPDNVTIVEVTRALEGIGGRPNDRG